MFHIKYDINYNSSLHEKQHGCLVKQLLNMVHYYHNPSTLGRSGSIPQNTFAKQKIKQLRPTEPHCWMIHKTYVDSPALKS